MKDLPGVALALAVVVALIPVNSAFAVLAATGAVHSAVTVAGTDAPLAGVTIKVLDMKTAEMVAEARTSDKGLAEIGEIPLGLYQVTVVAPEGYASTAGPLVFFDEENTLATLEFALEPLSSGTSAAAAQAGGIPIWALIAIVGGGAVAIGAVIAASGGSTQ